MITLTPENVAGVWKYLSSTYGTTIVDKLTAPEMKLATKLPQVPAGFLTDYATTIGTRIYLPFTPGVATSNWSLLAQVKVCAHEHQHVAQYRLDGIRYLWGYVVNPSIRAQYETEGYACNLEVECELGYPVTRTPADYAHGLKAYGCSQTDIDAAQTKLEAVLAGLQSGSMTGHMPSTLVVDYLRRISNLASLGYAVLTSKPTDRKVRA